MTNKRPDGGPAFATYVPEKNELIMEQGGDGLQTRNQHRPDIWQQGMSLRDYFAAHAPEMPAEFVKSDPWTDKEDGPHRGHFQCLSLAEKISFWRWHYADAMIAEREYP